MEPQLTAAWPVHTYPHLVLLPDGKVAVSSGTLLVRGQGRMVLRLAVAPVAVAVLRAANQADRG